METILNMNKLRTMCHLAAVFVCVCTRGTRVFVGACVCALTRAQMSVFLYASVCKCSVCVHAIGKTIVLHSAILTWCINVSPCPPLHQAPSSLLEALEQHLASLEGRKIKELSTATR